MTNDKFCRLLDMLIHGNMTALKAIFEEYFQSIEYTALKIAKNESDAYDIAVNVIMKLTAYSSDPYAIHNHIGLLINMTKHEALNLLKKKAFTVPFDERIEFVKGNNSNSDLLWIGDILRVLSEDEKNIFIQHCVWGESLKLICKRKGVSYRTIARIYSGIKAKIKKLYTDKY